MSDFVEPFHVVNPRAFVILKTHKLKVRYAIDISPVKIPCKQKNRMNKIPRKKGKTCLFRLKSSSWEITRKESIESICTCI